MFSCFCLTLNSENSGKQDENIEKNETMDYDPDNQIQELILEKDLQIQEFKTQLESAITTIKNKENRITELEKALLDLESNFKDLKTHFNELENIKNGENDKDKKIEQLEIEVRKHNHNLQGIVNTELWEKNREIEKLQNKLTDKLNLKDHEISKLEKDIMSKDMQLTILKEKIDELGIHINLPSSLINYKFDENFDIPEETDILKDQLKISNEKVKYLKKTVDELNQQLKNTPERESEARFSEIKSQFTQLQQEFDKSEKCRQEMGNVCILLTNRLEELATFLDSLLKHKSVLGLLGLKQQSAIKNAIDQSLDLSKTFNISFMSEDKSLAQLSSLTGFLNTSINTSEIMHDSYFEEKPPQNMATTLTYNSHLTQRSSNQQDVISEQNEIIGILRQQIETMKKEIEIRDTEIANQNINSTDVEKSLRNDQELVDALMDLQLPNKIEILSPAKIYENLFDKNTVEVIDNQSESEAWSEPDRNVSQARIGLDVESLKSNANTSRKSKHSSEETNSTSSSKYSPSSRTPSKRNSSDKMVNILQENIKIIENKLKEKDNDMLILQCKLMENDNKVKESHIKLHEELEKVRNEKADVENILKISEKLISSLEDKKQELLNKIDELIAERETLITNIHKKDDQIDLLTEKNKNLELTISDNDDIIRIKLEENDNKWKDKIQELQNDADIKIKDIKETTHNLKEKYEKNYVHKDEITKYDAKLNTVYQELESFKEIVKVAEQKEKSLIEKEIALNKKLQDSELENREKIIALKRELNEYALRTSQAVLERTKVNNEKLRLEQELRKLETRVSEKEAVFAEKEKQHINLKNNLQKQISQLELQKSHLQLKITELETSNVELQNRIMRLQSGDNKSNPSSPIKISEIPNHNIFGKHSLGRHFHYNRQRSDMSGYNSEDVNDENDAFNRSAPEMCHWFTNMNHNVTEVSAVRNIANSSPDLGIESDPGRFSSLETNISRPLLQTLELTASMNNLLSDNHNDTHKQICNVPSHKSLLKENEELLRKLEKTTSQLDIINKNKKQVEKAVCKQIHKTSIVLRKARANLDSGSENEILRK